MSDLDQVIAQAAHGSGMPWRGISLKALIASGYVKPPADIEVDHNGLRVARVIADSTVTWNGKTHDSPSTSAGS